MMDRVRSLPAVLAHYRRRGQVLLTHGQPHVFEVFATVAALIWAITLALPLNTLGSSPGFRVLAGAGLSEVGIAAAFAVVGGLQGWMLLRDHLSGRFGAALLACVGWTILALTLIFGNPIAPGGWMYLWVAVGQFWTAVRLGRARPWTPRSR